jgi:hypothetical protein
MPKLTGLTRLFLGVGSQRGCLISLRHRLRLCASDTRHLTPRSGMPCHCFSLPRVIRSSPCAAVCLHSEGISRQCRYHSPPSLTTTTAAPTSAITTTTSSSSATTTTHHHHQIMWARLMSFHHSGFLMGASCPQSGRGLVGSHACVQLQLSCCLLFFIFVLFRFSLAIPHSRFRTHLLLPFIPCCSLCNILRRCL